MPLSPAADLRHRSVSYASRLLLEPGATDGTDAPTVVDLAVAAKALASAALVLAQKVACTGEWRGHGHASPADWFASVCGTSVGEARRRIDTAKALAGLPATAATMAEGRLSTSQARHVTEAATADPSAEAYLLESAQTDTHQVLSDKAAQILSAATDPRDRDAKVRRDRSKRLRFNPDGSFDLHLHGPGVDGVRLQSRVRPYEEQIFATHRRDGAKDTFDNRCYDAFFNFLADLDAGASPPTGSTDPSATGRSDPEVEERFPPVPTPSGADPARRPRGGDNIKVIVRVDWTALARGHTVAGEICDVAGQGPITVETVRGLVGEAFLAAVVTKGRDVVTVAHLGRGCNAHQRTALEWSGIRCSNQACNRTVAIQVDHREPWAQNPETLLANQDPLCPACHRRKTHHGWTLAPGTGPRPFRPPPEPSVPTRSRAPDRWAGHPKPARC